METILQTYSSYMLRTTHWPVETPLQTCPSYMLRKTHWPVETVPQTDMSHKRSGKTHWPVEDPHPTPADISQLHHAEEDSLARQKLERTARFVMQTELS